MSSPIRTVLYGTGTNYLKTFVRMAGGIVTFRLLFKALAQQDFGFYQLLWSTFGYVVLLDFGFGVSIKKTMATNLDAAGDDSQRERREAISTVFFSYVAIDLLLALVFVLSGDHLLGILHYDTPTALAHYRTAASVFALGMLLGFPLGIYREALVGMNKIHVTNIIDIIASLLTTGLITWGCLSHWSLVWLMTASIATAVLPLAATLLVAVQDADLRPRFSDFRWGRLRALSSFSLFAYVITMTGLIMSQCDQLIIGSLVSVQAIALYVPGYKLMSFYWTMSSQMQHTLGPLAAQFHAMGDERLKNERLSALLLTSQRWAAMCSGLFVLPLLCDPQGALHLITGIAPPLDMQHAAICLIVACFFSIVGASCSKQILMMAGYHRGMLAFSLGEAIVNLGLSLYLTMLWRNCVGAAAGTLLATVLVSLVGLPIYAAVRMGLARSSLFNSSARGLAANAGALIACIFWWRFVPHFHPMWHFVIGCTVCVLAGLPGWWSFGMLASERERVGRVLRNLTHQGLSGNRS